MALYHSTFRRFDAPSCKVTPVVQLTTVSTILITACRTVFCRCSASRHTMKSLGIAGYYPVKPLRNLSGLQNLIFSTLPAITYTKC